MNENSKNIAPNCKHFVKRKKRYCKMTVKQGSEYCGEHLPNSNLSGKQNNEKTLRIVCPLDNKHTCFAHKLEKHLKICNARPKSLPYIQKGVNSGPNIDGFTSNTTRQLSNVKAEDIKVLVAKINQIYEDFIEGHIEEDIQKHPIVEEELQKPEYGERTKKHLIQASSIVGMLNEHDLFKNDTCYIEFGAGKGQLSYWVSQSISETQNSIVLLVERASHRHKMDNKLQKSDSHRIKVDIGDLVLKEVEIIKNYKSIVAVTKHLCGDATDLTIRCLENFEKTGGTVKGIIMAFCCHHRCTWTSYIGKTFFEECSLNDQDFDAICGMVSWAICGTGLSRDKKSSQETLESNDRDKIIGLTREEKEIVGRKCKRILDYGRLKYLKSCGFTSCLLKYYVSPKISPENVCVVALKQ